LELSFEILKPAYWSGFCYKGKTPTLLVKSRRFWSFVRHCGKRPGKENNPAARQGTASRKNGCEIFHQPSYNPDLSHRNRKLRLFLHKFRQALRTPGGWGYQNSKQSGHKNGKVVSPTHRPSLPPGDIPGTHVCYKASRLIAAGRIKSI